MCGITFAASSFLSTHEVDVWRQLQAVSIVRGADSTGCVVIRSDHNKKDKRGLAWFKDVCDPVTFVDHKTVSALLDAKDVDNKLIIGHNRLATVGKITRDNAHPFSFPNVIGVHNGTVHIDWKDSEMPDFESDSAKLYFQLNKNGIKHIVDTIGHQWDAYALTWWDKPRRRLCMIRNDRRPLAFANVSDSTIYGASEARMLEWVLKRNNATIKAIHEIKPFHLHEFDMSRGFDVKPEITDMTPVRKTYSYSYYGQHSNWDGYGEEDWEAASVLGEGATKAERPPFVAFGETRVWSVRSQKWRVIRWSDFWEGGQYESIGVNEPLTAFEQKLLPAPTTISQATETALKTVNVDKLSDDIQDLFNPAVDGVEVDPEDEDKYADCRPACMNPLSKYDDEDDAEELYQTYVSKEIVTEEELDEILDFGCACGDFQTVEMVTTDDNTILGELIANDTGGKTFMCLRCVNDMECMKKQTTIGKES